jgi:hypothetical protein
VLCKKRIHEAAKEVLGEIESNQKQRKFGWSYETERGNINKKQLFFKRLPTKHKNGATTQKTTVFNIKTYLKEIE